MWRVPYFHVLNRREATNSNSSFSWRKPICTKTKEPLNKSPSAEQRIFCSLSAVWKIGNTYSIPRFFKLSEEAKSLAVSSCRFNQSFHRLWLKVHKDFRESFVENKATCSWADAQQRRQRSFTQIRSERLWGFNQRIVLIGFHQLFLQLGPADQEAPGGK